MNFVLWVIAGLLALGLCLRFPGQLARIGIALVLLLGLGLFVAVAGYIALLELGMVWSMLPAFVSEFVEAHSTVFTVLTYSLAAWLGLGTVLWIAHHFLLLYRRLFNPSGS